jgi:hypothetical protein
MMNISEASRTIDSMGDWLSCITEKILEGLPTAEVFVRKKYSSLTYNQ